MASFGALVVAFVRIVHGGHFRGDPRTGLIRRLWSLSLLDHGQLLSQLHRMVPMTACSQPLYESTDGLQVYLAAGRGAETRFRQVRSVELPESRAVNAGGAKGCRRSTPRQTRSS